MHRIAFLPTLLFPVALWAQTGSQTGPDLNTNAFPDFAILNPGSPGFTLLIAIAAGLLLALCFQWLLTVLSAAVGFSALRLATDQDGRGEARQSSPSGRSSENRPGRETAHGEDGRGREDEGEGGGAGGAVRRVEAGLGWWALITSCLALFFASWLAVELVRMQNNLQGAITGVVIWGVFTLAILRMEASLAASLSGLAGYAAAKAREGIGLLLSPLRAAAGSLAEASERSGRREESVLTAGEVAAAVRRELFPEPEETRQEEPGMAGRIRDFVQAHARPMASDAARVGHDLKTLLTDPEIIAMAKRGELMDMGRARFAEIVAGRTDLDKGQVDSMVDALHRTWSRFIGEHGPGRPGARLAVEPAPGASGSGQGGAARYRRFKEYLRSTGREELSPERLEQEVKTLVLDPTAGLAQLREHFQELDRESLVQTLAARKDISPEEARRIADQIDLARRKVLSAREEAEHRVEGLRDGLLAKVRDLVYAADRPELDYEGFEADFRKLFDDPKAGYEALKERLTGLDRESIIALLGAQTGISRGEAAKAVEKGGQVLDKAEAAAGAARAGIGKLADKIVAAKDAALERARLVEEETRRRLDEAKRLALEQAEAARKTASTAAWWMLAIGFASAVAAALGGLIGAAT